MLLASIDRIVSTFTANVESVYELMNFDRLVLDVAIRHLEQLQERLTKLHGFDNPRFDVGHTLTLLRGIHDHDSLEHNYREMLNQCNVLLVSYFSSAVGDIFKSAVSEAVRSGAGPALLAADIRLTLREVREIAGELVERSGELFTAHRDISFQDMQSIGRSFREYFDYDPPKNEVVNDIIVSQGCRHVIVHSGGIVDRKLLRQVANAEPRTLHVDLVENRKVQFSESDISIVGDQMKVFVQTLAFNVDRVIDERARAR
jgi:hypothetical protein